MLKIHFAISPAEISTTLRMKSRKVVGRDNQSKLTIQKEATKAILHRSVVCSKKLWLLYDIATIRR